MLMVPQEPPIIASEPRTKLNTKQALREGTESVSREEVLYNHEKLREFVNLFK